MRKIVVIAAVLVLLVATTAIFLVATTPHESAGVHFPLSASQRALLASVPADADSFALVPTAAALESKLRANPVTAEALEQFAERESLPRGWMLGRADVLVSRSGKSTTYLVRLDLLRAFLAKVYLAVAGEGNSRLLINESGAQPMAAGDIDALVALTSGLPAGDALVVQLAESRGAFPPIVRPAVSSVSITPASIDITSRAANAAAVASPQQLRPRFPRAAILTAAFTSPPRILDEANRLIGAKASTLLSDGGAIALYEIDTDKLLPRPREVVVLPATPERKATLEKFAADTVPRALSEATGFRINTAEAGGELLVAFDDASINRYRGDTFDPPTLPGNAWSLRVDPQRAVPVLEQISDNPGLRLIAPRLFRSARDLGGWIEHLKNARSVEAAMTTGSGFEELRVRVASK
jgi:hypothetical protein